MSIDLGSTQLSLPVFLAPLAGITDLPFRNLVQSFGAGLVVSEMIASQEMVEAKYSVRDRLNSDWVLKTPRFKLRAVIHIGCQRPQD